MDILKRVLVWWLLCLSFQLQAAERILDFDSEIVVHVDGSQRVTETIRVRAEGNRIKRGIYRDFPTRYSANGKNYKVDFQVVEVLRNGQPEAWHLQRLGNGIRVYFGRSEVFLAPGIYTYQLTYLTDRQLGLFETHDELYWNVTGNGWDFPIDRVSAQVMPPLTTPLEEVTAEAFTGAQGDAGRGYRVETRADGPFFETTRPLKSREGLTIVVSWPKGHVRAPTWQDRLEWRWRDEPGLFIVWAGLPLLLAYYFLAWLRVGRDPKTGVILPRYEPPVGYSAAALRLIRQMGYDEKVMSAALVSLAVKGAIRIEEKQGTYTATPTGKDGADLTPDEAAVLSGLDTGLTFKNSNHSKVSDLMSGQKTHLDTRYRKKYFYANRGWLLPGWLLTAITLGCAGWASLTSYDPQALFAVFLCALIIAFIAPFIRQLWQMRKVYERRMIGWIKLAASTLPIFLLGGIFELADLNDIIDHLPWPMVIGMAAMLFSNFLFHYLMKAPTVKGRKLLDQTEGFRQYLSLAEGDELRANHDGSLTPEKFEAFLPFAIALDVETEWAERFSADMQAAGRDPSGYRSHWYSGSDFSGVRGISTSVSSALASSVVSASRAPGSSSGSSFSSGGGGGFSGGGGGGGGGGGW